MSRIYRVDDGRAVRERQRALPKGTVAEVWPDVFDPRVFWIGEASKRLLEAAGLPLSASATIEASGIAVFLPDELQDRSSLPPEESLRTRVLAGHGIAVTWYATPQDTGGRPLPEPTSPEDAFFYLMRMGGRGNHVWRLFRTRDEAVQFMARFFPNDAKAQAWAAALPAARYAELLRGESP
jgi:hypothetical protein